MTLIAETLPNGLPVARLLDRPTPIEMTVLRYIDDYVQARGCAPDLQEIAAATGYHSLEPAHRYVSRLVQKGWLQRDAGRHRGLILLARPPRAATEPHP